MKNKELILKRLDAIIKSFEAENNKSKLAQKDLHAFKTLRRQYFEEDIAGIKHTANNWIETATREMLPMECGELMDFEPLHKPKPKPELPKVGDKIIIRHNPHHAHLQNAIGEVMSVDPGEGFMGCDLITVGYYDTDGETYMQRPFAMCNLEITTIDALLQEAKRHEAEAAKLRAMVESTHQ